MEKKQFLKIEVNQQLVLVPLHFVFMAVYIPSLLQVPSKISAFKGVLNYHGKSISVYCLGEILSQQPKSYSVNTPLLLCEVKDRLLGLIIDDVHEVIEIDGSKIQKNLDETFYRFTTGVYESETLSAWVLDVKKLLDEKQLTMEP